jgi:hypothetical protein
MKAEQTKDIQPACHKLWTRPLQAYGRALKCCKPGCAADEALQPKVYVNLGITQEAEGLLMSACDHYK